MFVIGISETDSTCTGQGSFGVDRDLDRVTHVKMAGFITENRFLGWDEKESTAWKIVRSGLHSSLNCTKCVYTRCYLSHQASGTSTNLRFIVLLAAKIARAKCP